MIILKVRKKTRHLDSGFGQIDFQGELLAEEDVRVVRALERFLQFVQLHVAERRPVAHPVKKKSTQINSCSFLI